MVPYPSLCSRSGDDYRLIAVNVNTLLQALFANNLSLRVDVTVGNCYPVDNQAVTDIAAFQQAICIVGQFCCVECIHCVDSISEL